MSAIVDIILQVASECMAKGIQKAPSTIDGVARNGSSHQEGVSEAGLPSDMMPLGFSAISLIYPCMRFPSDPSTISIALHRERLQSALEVFTSQDTDVHMCEPVRYTIC
jgi:hypothetical protein